MPDPNPRHLSRPPDSQEAARKADLRVPAAREAPIGEEKSPALPLRVLVAVLLIGLVGGFIMGQGGSSLFNYSSYTRNGYVRAGAPGVDLVLATGELHPALLRHGARVYSTCAVCHQGNGAGARGLAPPLDGSEWVIGENTEALAMIILKGLKGPITVKGETWDIASGMAPQGEDMTAKDLASVMTYIRSSFGNDVPLVTVEMAQAAMEKSKARASGQQFTVPELEASHMAPLTGKPLAPGTIVNLEDLQPVVSPR